MRMAFRAWNIREALDAGKLLVKIVTEIQEIYDKIQHSTAVKSKDEIAKLIETTRIFPHFQKIPKEIIELSSGEAEEKELRNTIISLVNFFGWLPQDNCLVTEEEKGLIEYFNKLMYSMKHRLAIIEDKEKKEARASFDKKLERAMIRIREAEQCFEKILQKNQKFGLKGVEVQILQPRQSEDYFPAKGVIENFSLESIQSNIHIVKLEIKEPNHLHSLIVFTGNNTLL
jgi:hypothetical protein